MVNCVCALTDWERQRKASWATNGCLQSSKLEWTFKRTCDIFSGRLTKEVAIPSALLSQPPWISLTWLTCKMALEMSFNPEALLKHRDTHLKDESFSKLLLTLMRLWKKKPKKTYDAFEWAVNWKESLLHREFPWREKHQGQWLTSLECLKYYCVCKRK